MAFNISNVLLNITRTTFLPKISMIRGLSQSASKNGKSLLYTDYGEPIDVLKLTEVPDEKPGDNKVAVKWLLSPVNPADINVIQGKYPSRPTLPAVPGNEGVGEIIRVGAGVKSLCVGDRVVPNDNHIGTWRTQANYSPNTLLKVLFFFILYIKSCNCTYIFFNTIIYFLTQ